MKQLVHAALRQLGYRIARIDRRPTPEELTTRWLRSEGIQTVIDAGGGWGDFALRTRRMLPQARIISYETHEPSLNILNNAMKEDTNFESHFIALHNYNGVTAFHISSYDGSSSLLPMADLHKDAYPASKLITQVEVNCGRLDDLLDVSLLKRNILFKLDVQGAEKLVLEGAQNVLAQSSIVHCEVNFQELYDGCVMVNDLVAFLHTNGFRINGIENVSQHPVTGTYLQADAWFVRT